jgi:hypothetical protein
MLVTWYQGKVKPVMIISDFGFVISDFKSELGNPDIYLNPQSKIRNPQLASAKTS